MLPSHIDNLEAQVRDLEEQLRSSRAESFGIQPDHYGDPQTWKTQTYQPFDEGALADGEIATAKPYLGFQLDRMVQLAINVDNGFPHSSVHQNPMFPPLRPAGCPLRYHANFPLYLESYISNVHPCFPFVNPELLRQQLEDLISSADPTQPEVEPLFLMVIAIGAVISGSCCPIGSFHGLELYTIAVEGLGKNLAERNLECLNTVLLLAIFSLYSPYGGSTYHLVGLATQISISIGLHQRKSTSNGDALTLRNCSFWSCYILDR